MKLGLFVIDPQNDFCSQTGSLFVPGADKDMERLSAMVARLGSKLKSIFVTMDSHHIFDVAHPSFWVDRNLDHPQPYTIISVDDVISGTWRTSIPTLGKWAEEYVKGLASKGRFPLCIWPEHCIIGSSGNNIYPQLFNSLCEWEKTPGNFVQYQTKGSNFKTEHYSVFEAEYPDPSDPSTQFNSLFANAINSCDKVLIAGEARTHCVINSLRSLIEYMGEDFIRKMIFIEDASSNVTAIPDLVIAADNYFADLKNKGMEVTTTDSFLI